MSVVFHGQSLSLTPTPTNPTPHTPTFSLSLENFSSCLDMFSSAVPPICYGSWSVSFSHPYPYQPHSMYTNLLIILGELLKLFLMSFLRQFHLSVMFHGQSLSLTPTPTNPTPCIPTVSSLGTSWVVLDEFSSAVPPICNVSLSVSFSHPYPYQLHSPYTNLLIILGELFKLFLMSFIQQFYLSVMFHGQPLSLTPTPTNPTPQTPPFHWRLSQFFLVCFLQQFHLSVMFHGQSLSLTHTPTNPTPLTLTFSLSLENFSNLFLMSFLQQFHLSVVFHGQSLSLIPNPTDPTPRTPTFSLSLENFSSCSWCVLFSSSTYL